MFGLGKRDLTLFFIVAAMALFVVSLVPGVQIVRRVRSSTKGDRP